MATDQQIGFRLTASDQTSAVVDKVRGSLGLLERKANDLQGAFVSGLAAQLSAALAPAAIAAFVTRVARGVDALNDLKDATGSSVENISALEDVAARTGTSFDAVGTSLVKFNGALNDAKPGSAASNVLKGLGLDAERLRQLDPAEALRQTAVALSRFADDGNKARAVQELFGRSLREVAPFLADLAKQGELVATVTTKQAEEAERFSQNLDALAKNSKDAARSLVADLLPALNGVLNSFIKFGGVKGTLAAALGVDELGQAQSLAKAQSNVMASLGLQIQRFEAMASNGVQGAAERAVTLRTQLQALQASALKTTDTIKKLSNQLAPDNSGDKTREDRGFVPTLPKLSVPGSKELKVEISDAQRALASYVNTLERELDKTREISEEQKALNLLKSIGALGQVPAVRELVLALAAQNDQLRDQADLQKLAADAEKAYARALDDLLASTADAQIEDIVELERKLNEQFVAGKVNAEKYAQALDILSGKYDALTPKVEETTEEISKFAEQAARNIQDALGDTLEQVLGGHFENIGKLWLNLINRMVAQALAAKLNDALFGQNLSGGLLGGALSSIFSLGSGGAGAANGSWDVLPPPSVGGGGSTVINVAAGPTRQEVLSAIQLASAAGRADTRALLRSAGAI